jgi:hypothetical protein
MRSTSVTSDFDCLQVQLYASEEYRLSLLLAAVPLHAMEALGGEEV